MPSMSKMTASKSSSASLPNPILPDPTVTHTFRTVATVRAIYPERIHLLSECSLTTLCDVARATPLPADERRAAILAATEPLLMQYGRDVSTRQIAEAAGIAEGTIFRVFPNKDAVIDAVIEDAFEARADSSGPDRDRPRRSTSSTRLEQAVEILEARMRRVISSVRTPSGAPAPPPDDPSTRPASTGTRNVAEPTTPA